MSLGERMKSPEGRAELEAETDAMNAVTIGQRLAEISTEMARENSIATDEGRPDAERDAAHGKVIELGKEVARLTAARAKIVGRYS